MHTPRIALCSLLLAASHVGGPFLAAPHAQAPRTDDTSARGARAEPASMQAYEASAQRKLSPSIVYSTYFGPENNSSSESYAYVSDIATDPDGNLVAVGTTTSPDFPQSTAGAFQPSLHGGSCNGGPCGDAFVARLDPSGSRLLAATYLGGGGTDYAGSVFVDGEGVIYVSGGTASADFPTTPDAFQPASRGGDCGGFPCTDAFLVKLDASLSTLLASTLLGGSGLDAGSKIGVDASGNIYLGGTTSSPDLPTTPGVVQPSYGGGPDAFFGDGFVAKLDPALSGLGYLTYFGGSGGDSFSGPIVDAEGNAYVTGYTSSSDLPVTPDAIRAEGPLGSSDAFVAKLDSSGTALVYSTYLGGGGREFGGNLAVDRKGNAYVTGQTASVDFPTTPQAFDAACDTCEDTDQAFISDAFVAKVSADGGALVYSTYLGGTLSDFANAIAVDARGRAYVGGGTFRTEFPLKRAVNEGGAATDGFITVFNERGTKLVFSTLFGGGAYESVGQITLDRAGNIHVAGSTLSFRFPTTAGTLQPERVKPGWTTFIAKFALR